jgi:asparagine synthase (glutamine-hydrolysing)
VQQQSAQYLAALFGAGNDRTDDPLYSHRPRFRRTAATKAFFSGDLHARLGNNDAAAELAATLPAEFKRWHTLHQAQYWRAVSCCPATFSAARAIEWQWRTVSRDGSPSSTIAS